MTTYERLLEDASATDVEVINFLFKSSRIKGLYCDGIIALNKCIATDIERSCILAEEIGHFHTTVGDILCQSSISNRKQEHRARLWAYNKLIGLNGIVSAYKNGCYSISDTADYLNVTEEFLAEALNCYKSKYGIYVLSGNYVIYFEPSIGVLELI